MTTTRHRRGRPWRALMVAGLAAVAFAGPATAASALWSTTPTTPLAVTTSPAVVPPAAPSGLSCQLPPGKKSVSTSWTTVAGLTYDLVLATGSPVKSAVTPPVTLTNADVSGTVNIYVRAANAAGSTLSSKYFEVSLPTGPGSAACAVKP